MRTKYLFVSVIGACVVLTDQLSKQVVIAGLQPGRAITVLPRLLSIRHVQNPVAAYGALTGLDNAYRVPILILFPIVLLAALIYALRQIEDRARSLLLAFSLILGGAVGNLIDRLALGHVTDFLVFQRGRSHSAVYNLADLCILAGMAMILALTCRRWLASEPSPAEAAAPKTL
jgi:signal peptidase II